MAVALDCDDLWRIYRNSLVALIKLLLSVYWLKLFSNSLGFTRFLLIAVFGWLTANSGSLAASTYDEYFDYMMREGRFYVKKQCSEGAKLNQGGTSFWDSSITSKRTSSRPGIDTTAWRSAEAAAMEKMCPKVW
jgi:hypothetical protein